MASFSFSIFPFVLEEEKMLLRLGSQLEICIE